MGELGNRDDRKGSWWRRGRRISFGVYLYPPFPPRHPQTDLSSLSLPSSLPFLSLPSLISHARFLLQLFSGIPKRPSHSGDLKLGRLSLFFSWFQLLVPLFPVSVFCLSLHTRGVGVGGRGGGTYRGISVLAVVDTSLWSQRPHLPHNECALVCNVQLIRGLARA